MRVKTKEKPMRKKWGMKRKISLLLLVMQVISSIPNLDLMIRVMANPNAGEVAVDAGGNVALEEEAAMEGLLPEDLPEEPPIVAAEPFVEADFGKNAFFAASATMEMGGSAFEPTAIPDDTIYDEMYEEDMVISTHSTISGKKILYKGNLTIDANVNFKNTTIRVEGTIHIQQGYMNMENSSVVVDGDFRIQAKSVDGTYQITNGYMNLNTNANMKVKGDFYTESANSSNQINGKGRLELEGKFTHIGDTYFRTSGKYQGRLIFTGKGEQHLSFGESAKVVMDGIMVANELGKLYLDTRMPRLALIENMILVGNDVEIASFTMEEYDLTIEGNYLIHENSVLYHWGAGTLFIEGDFRVQSKLEDGTYGETSGFMRISSEGKIVVKGDFYTQSTSQSNSLSSSGIFELHGNFNHIGDTWFGGGNLTFVGEKEQHISFGETTTTAVVKASIGSVVVNNKLGKLYVDTFIPRIHLTHNTILTGQEVELGYVGENGYDLKIEGDFLVNERSKTSTTGSKSTWFVEGDLRVQSKKADGTYGITNGLMLVSAGTRMVVKGNLYSESTHKSNGVGINGILEIKGNLYQIGDTWFEIADGYSGRMLFSGEGEQSVSISHADKFVFKNFAQGETCTAIILEAPFVNEIKPASDVVIGGSSQVNVINSIGYTTHFKDEMIISDWTDSSRGAILFDRDVKLISSRLNANDGIVRVKGNLYLEGESAISINNEKGMMVIEGSVYNNSTKIDMPIHKGLLEIKGDYIQSTMVSFTSSSTAMVQFSSPNHQRISFPEEAKVWFQNLGVDPELNYTFSKEPIWTNLYRAYDTSKISNNIAAKQFGKAGTNATTGNYSQSFFDMSIPSIIGPLNITHTYNSLSETEGVLGKGFVFSQNMKLQSEEFMEKEHVTITLPNGARQSFIKNAKGVYDAQDSRSSLTKSGTSYLLTGLDNTKTTFHENGNILSMEDRLGNRLTYQVNSDGNITSIQDVTGTSISITYDGTKITEVKNQVTGDQTFFFYADNKLEKSMDATGKSTSYQYDDAGFLSKITNHDGTTFEEITYISEGSHKDKVSTITNAAGNVSTYAYDDSLRKTTITDSNGRQTIKEFDLRYYITSTIDALGNRSVTNYVIADGVNKYGETASETDVFGNTTSYTRDGKGNITRISYPNGSFESSVYDAYNNVIKTVNRAGTAIHFIYDSEGKNLLKKVEPLDGVLAYSESASQDLFAITTYTYDSSHAVKGLALTETRPLGDEENYIKNEYNQKGQLSKQIRFINGDPYATSYTYNGKNLPIREVAPDGVVTEIAYNKRDEVIRKKIIRADGSQETVERTVYDSLGRKVMMVSPLEYEAAKDNLTEDTYTGVGTCLIYDSAGMILAQTNALGDKTSYQYDLYGNVLRETLPDGSYAEMSYDVLNRQISSSFYDHVTDKMEEIDYAQSGRNLQVTTTSYLEDSRTAVTTAITDYEGRTLNVKNAEGTMVSMTYTKSGKPATETNLLGKVTTYAYDKRDFLISVTTPFEGSAWAKTVYTYNEAGNPLSEEVYTNKVGDAFSSTRKTEYQYDAWDNTEMVIQYDGETPIHYIQMYYDFKGNILRQYKGLSSPLLIEGLDQVTTGEDEAFHTSKSEYNYLNKPVEGINTIGQVETNQYDVAGNLISSVDYSGGTYEVQYDILGRIESEEKTASGKDTISKDYLYDNRSQLISVTENGIATELKYNGKGQILEEETGEIRKAFTYDQTGAVLAARIYENTELLKETGYTYDKMGRLLTVLEGDVLKASYGYDKGSRLLTTKHGNGLTESKTYNDAGLVKSVVNKDKAGVVLSEYQYGYAVDGNQLSKMDAGGTTTYQYDGLNRLLEESHQLGVDTTTTRYDYDEMSNLLSRETEAPDGSVYEHYSYNELDQLLKQTGTKGQIIYSYDENGSMVSKKSGGKTEQQTYDALDRLIAWTDGESEAEYTYNSSNKRSSKTVDGVTTEHIWIGEEIQLDKTEGELVSYTHGIDLISSDHGDYLYNAHGDVVQVIEGNQISQWYDYNAYGQIINQKAEDGSDLNPYRYAGEYRDRETGYVYLRARYYDPEISRFINVDPMRDGLNWYGYAGGNPVMHHDPSGYALETILDVVGLGFSIYDMVTEPSWMNAAFLAWDVIGILVPFVPGSYVGKGGKAMKAISKVASKVDDAVDVGKAVVKKVAKHVAKGLSKADDVGDFVKGTIKLESKTGLLGKAAETIGTALKVNEIRGYVERAYEGISGADGYKVSDERRTHILEGDEHGNGHGPNREKPKGAFPDTWTDDQVIDAVERVANSPDSVWDQRGGSGVDTITVGGPSPNAPTHTNGGKPVRFEVIGQDHGLTVGVIIEPSGEGIITGYNKGAKK